MLLLEVKFLLTLSVLAFGYVSGHPSEKLQKRETSDNSFFSMILDALKTIEEDVAQVSSEMVTNGNQVEEQLTQLTSSIDDSKTAILSDLTDINNDIGNVESSLTQSINNVDKKVGFVVVNFRKISSLFENTRSRFASMTVLLLYT